LLKENIIIAIFKININRKEDILYKIDVAIKLNIITENGG